ncbi:MULTISPECIES: thiamine pyrophosphate-binding protein [unclassified Streptomyces]|uniref:thiamine pyrophosphate-binding protein n=1 Tax=unclassified Streptomyces TaxID=2593676 RepID=UPI001F03360F|nr:MULTISPECIES: thiamine pyrophosphate-binding protein [unclassified Streptomyces]MCH0564587.1 thiamine pyrophosphate-binding protein [Streptomyces sp. MUM 2J]MCH0572056.1 thiamine pyrophosphate-binding protein [Streptomyces sp. MUM 136J]
MTTTAPEPRTAEPLRLVDHLASALAGAGVTHLFGVGGANIEDLYDAVHRGGAIRGVVAKHEFSAVTMADGYARTTGRLGVVAATSGGGAMNLVPGLAEAHASRVPVLALVGQPPTDQEGLGAFQDSSGKSGSFDAQQIFTPLSRFCARVDDPHSLAELLPRAVEAAQAEPRGPAVLLLPKDVQQALIHVPARAAAPPPNDPSTTSVARLDAVAVSAVSDALREAGRVLVIAGEGVAAADARGDLAELARRLGAWVAVTPDAKDVFDNRDPRFAGVAGVMGHANVEACLRRADLCLLAGTRLPLLARGGLDRALAGTDVVCLGPEPPFVAGTALGGNLRDALRAVASGLPSRPLPCPPHSGPLPTPTPAPLVRALGRTVPHARAVAAVEAALPEDAHVFVDAGNAGASAIHLLPAPRHGRFVVAVGMGGMGYTFGAGIGAALATGRRTYVLAGDGSFFMHGMEVHTAVEYGAPVTFVIFNNNAHAMCALREEFLQGGVRDDDLFARTDLAAGVAAAFPSLRATEATDAAQLRAALLRGNAGGGPALVSVACDPREIPPFLPFQSFTEAVKSKEGSDERHVVHVG